MTTDVAIVGLGPAGRALAARCLAAGLSVTAVDPRPLRVWTPTYALWADELPAWLDRSVVAALVPSPRVRAHREHTVARPYAVLDTPGLQRALGLDGARVVAGRARVVAPDHVELDDGSVLRAGHVVDARGQAPGPGIAQQTAYGVIVPRERGAPALGEAPAWFMDWLPDNGAGPGETPSFLYAIPLDDDRVLLEETCLAGRPAPAPDRLRTRLLTRAAARGIELRPEDHTETVRIALHGPRPPRPWSPRSWPPRPWPAREREAIRFGAGGALLHPCTGYSLGSSLQLADPLARALGSGDEPRELLWPWSAATVHTLRMRGLSVLLGLEPEPLTDFFESFFTMPQSRQRAFLSVRDRPAAVAAAMWDLFRRVPMPVRRRLARAVLPD